MVISIMNLKGGQGKTTTTFQISLILNAMGYKVLAIDLDGQGNLTSALNKTEKKIESFLPDYLMNPEDEHKLINARTKGLHYIANERLRNSKARKIISGMGWEGQTLLKNLIDPLREHYDFILIDCAPDYDILSENTLLASDKILIPTELSKESMKGMISLMNLTQRKIYQQFNKDISILGVFLFRPNERTKYQNEAKKILHQIVPENKIFKTAIRENIRVAESMAIGESVVTYAPKSNGAIDFYKLTKEFLKKSKNV